jgi:cobalt-zinc-cadmium efflux system membrane fusion protein
MNEEIEIEEKGVYETEHMGRPPRRQWIIIGSVIVIALIGLTAWLMIGKLSKREEATAVTEKGETGKVKFLMEQQWLVRMKLAKVEQQTVARQITSIGRVVPAANSQALVSTPVAGILSDRALPNVGQYVAGGQPIAAVRQTATAAEQAQTRAALMQMESQNAQLEIERARLESEKRAAAGTVESNRVRLDAAKRERDRIQRLFDGMAASQKQLQAAESEVASAQASYEAAVRTRDALASVSPVSRPSASARHLSGNGTFTVVAPFGGYVTKVNKSIGEQVSPGDAIVEISNLDTVYVEAPIFERDLNMLGGSRAATFTVSAYPQEFRGAVIDIGATIDEQTRAANVIFRVENAGRALRLGMQANVRLDAETAVTAMMVPREAILEHEGRRVVYVLLSGEEFERRDVTVGDEYGDKIAVLSGLEADERVVTQGAYQLKLQELRPAEPGAHSHET